MKKNLLFFLLTTLTLTVWAEKVPVERAQEYATAYLQEHSPSTIRVKSTAMLGNEQDAYYLINFLPQGWALVAADDLVSPIIAYSAEGSLDMNRLPDNMKFMLNQYEKQMLRIIQTEKDTHPRWLTPIGALTRASGVAIEPLIQVNWNQSNPYNVYCPMGKALVGCVAVAMSQAMSVQRYPARPTGSVSYSSANYGAMKINFDNERAYNWDDIMSGANNYDEAARLLYHAGMSVKMMYGEDGSGIPSSDAARISNALKVNFSYPDDVRHVKREQYTDDWQQLLLNELNAGRAIVYNGIDEIHSSGHSFNIDGYDGDGHFHVNWGWGGYGNNYFSLEALRDMYQGYSFDASHEIIIGIGAPDRVLKSISLSNDEIEENLPAGSVVGFINVNSEAVKETYEVTVHGTYDSKTESYKQVPFTYENGMLKTTEQLSSATPKWNIEITVKDSKSGTSLTQGFRILVNEWKSLEETTSLSFDRKAREFKLSTKHNVTYTLSNEQGMELGSGSLEPVPQLIINVASLPEGKNTLTLKCQDESKSIQLIK